MATVKDISLKIYGQIVMSELNAHCVASSRAYFQLANAVSVLQKYVKIESFILEGALLTGVYVCICSQHIMLVPQPY